MILIVTYELMILIVTYEMMIHVVTYELMNHLVMHHILLDAPSSRNVQAPTRGQRLPLHALLQQAQGCKK
jgi:hypothetical protein